MNILGIELGKKRQRVRDAASEVPTEPAVSTDLRLGKEPGDRLQRVRGGVLTVEKGGVQSIFERRTVSRENARREADLISWE